MKIKNIINAIKHGDNVCDNTFVTPRGSFAYSGLMVCADRYKISVYKDAKLVWSSTDDFDVKLCRVAVLNR